MPAIESMLAAVAEGRIVAIGQEPLDRLRALSDSRKLACPLCRAPVVLRAGTVLAPHFAHLPGWVCAHPHAEPETEQHRAGKAALAAWLTERLPRARITLEAAISQTGQRADVHIGTCAGQRIVIEYQCADLSAREWRRRHRLYRDAGILDLWILGANRLALTDGVLRTGELERAMFWDRAPLLFLDSTGERLTCRSIARFRPTPQADHRCLRGRLSVRPLADLPFPWRLLDWPCREIADMRWRITDSHCGPHPNPQSAIRNPQSPCDEARIWWWLRVQHGVRPETLAPFFGIDVDGAEAFACSARLWQACVYYRWIHGRVGDSWWIEEVNVWARRYLPLAVATGRRAHRALFGYQMLLSAAGMISVPYGRGSARVTADLITLATVPAAETVQRIAGYRRTLRRE